VLVFHKAGFPDSTDNRTRNFSLMGSMRVVQRKHSVNIAFDFKGTLCLSGRFILEPFTPGHPERKSY
jgi:hypothetical protein